MLYVHGVKFKKYYNFRNDKGKSRLYAFTAQNDFIAGINDILSGNYMLFFY